MATIVKITEEIANAYRTYVKYDKAPHKDNAELFAKMKDLTGKNSILRDFIIRLRNQSSYSGIVSYLDNTDLKHYDGDVDIKFIKLDDDKLSEFVDIVHTAARDTVKEFGKENIDISDYLRKNLWKVISNLHSCKSNPLRLLGSCISGYFYLKYEKDEEKKNDGVCELYNEYGEKLANF